MQLLQLSTDRFLFRESRS